MVVFDGGRLYESKGVWYIEKLTVEDVKTTLNLPYIAITYTINLRKWQAKRMPLEFILDTERAVSVMPGYASCIKVVYTLPDGRVITDSACDPNHTPVRILPAGTHVKVTVTSSRYGMSPTVYVSDVPVSGRNWLRFCSVDTGVCYSSTAGYCDLPSVGEIYISTGRRTYTTTIDIRKEGLYVKDVVCINMTYRKTVMFKVPVDYYAIGMRVTQIEQRVNQIAVTYEIKDFMEKATKVPIEIYDYNTGQVLSRQYVNVGTVTFTNNEGRMIRARGYKPEASATGDNNYGHGWYVYYYTKLPELPAPKFEVIDMKVNGQNEVTLNYGEKATITVTVKNVGDLEGQATVSLMIGNATIASTDTPVIPPGGTYTATFDFTAPNTTVSYTVCSNVTVKT